MTRRPVLAPGLRPLRHASGDLVFGLAPEHRLCVPDTPAVRRALAILDRGEALPDTAEMRRTRRLLTPVLRDGDTLVRPGLDAGEVAAVSLRHPRTGSLRLDARRRASLRVEGDLGTDVTALVDAVGLGRATERDPSPSAVLVLSRDEPDREHLDELVRAGIPHLVVRAVEGEVVLGPFVLPGTTACVRCCDLQRRASDAAYGALLDSLAGSSRRDGVAEPVPVTLAWTALGWAVGDLVRHAEGEVPTTASTLVRLAPGDVLVSTLEVAAHPGCSCRWSAGVEDFGTSVTMGA